MKYLLLITALLSTSALSSVTWSWDHDGKHSGGDDAPGVYFKLTCNGNQPHIINFPETSFTNSPPEGKVITCSVTAYDTDGHESGAAPFETWIVGGGDITLNPATNTQVEEN